MIRKAIFPDTFPLAAGLRYASAREITGMFVHTLLAYTALPDRFGEISLRLIPFQRATGILTNSDMAIHSAAGISNETIKWEYHHA